MPLSKVLISHLMRVWRDPNLRSLARYLNALSTVFSYQQYSDTI